MTDDERRTRAQRTVDRALERVLAHDMPGFAALWAPDGTMEFPFAPSGAPRRLAGRDAVAAYVAGYNDLLRPERVVSQTRHETADADTLVVEFTVAGRLASSGADYELGYVAVVTVGSEGITSYRDYWSPAAVTALTGDSELTGTAW